MKKFRLFVLVIISLLLLAIAGTVYYVLLGQWHTTSYAAGRSNQVKVYCYSDEITDSGADSGSDETADTGTDSGSDKEKDAGADSKASDGTADSEAAEEADSKADEKTAEEVEAGADDGPETEGHTETTDSTDGHVLVEAGYLIRGTEVSRYRKSVTQDGITYHKVTVSDPSGNKASAEPSDDDTVQSTDDEMSTGDDAQSSENDSALSIEEAGALSRLHIDGDIVSDDSEVPELYMAEESLADTIDGTVLETEVYVRTAATIYEEPGRPDIASFAPKGTHLEVTGHDRLLSNGFINMYKVEYTDDEDEKQEGYVYGKYMTDTKESAEEPYNEHGEYDAAAGDKFRFELYGGKAKNLDFYPYERTEIEGNEFCRYARAMYLNAYAAVHPKQYVKLIRKSGCNAVVIDLKDGPLTYGAETAKELSPTSYKKAYYTEEELRKGVEAYREAGVYLIGRIVTFNDPNYAKDHPEDCISYKGDSGWPSAFSRDVWEYNVKLAQEAVEKFGFNEIQFDYVRFPESTYEMSKSGKADFRNEYGESKAQAVQNFCFYAADQLRESGAYISVDVFGESAYSYVTAYGQYWTAISNIVDAISAMPYTDHFDGKEPWKKPYDSVKNWAEKAEKQQNRLQDSAAARTWITGYNTPHWAPEVDYNEKRMKAQIKALEDCGLDGGFIPWNVLSDLGKYKEYQGIWNAE